MHRVPALAAVTIRAPAVVAGLAVLVACGVMPATALARLLGSADFLARLQNQAASDPSGALGPAEMLAYIRSQMPKLAQLVRESGVKID